MTEFRIVRRINPRNVMEVLKKDFKDVFTKNPIVVLTLLAIIILPSLYALINIQACWDPYDLNLQLPIWIKAQHLRVKTLM